MSMSWGEYGNQLIKLAELERIPILGQFELTPRCNLRCRMCYISEDENKVLYQERDTKDWISLARQARERGMLYLTLTGGEVFVRKDFRTIYEELTSMGLVIQINTNATLITPEIASWLGRRPPSSIAITIYGASADTYLKICRDGSGYNRMLRGIELLREQGIKLRIRTTVVRGNAEEFYELSRLTEQYETTLNLVNYVYQKDTGFLSCPETQRLSPEELTLYEDNNIAYYQDKWNKVIERKQAEEYTPLLPIPSLEKPAKKHPFECISGKGRFSVTWEGKMVPCVFMKSPSTEPFLYGFQRAWEELVQLCSELPTCEECNQCSYKEKCMSCPASRMMETGCFDKPVPYLCEYMKLKYR